MNKVILIEDEVRKKYIDKKEPMWKIADDLNVSIGSVFNCMKKFGIESRDMKEIMTGFKHSKASCEKISKIHKGKIVSLETRTKISNAHTGRFTKPTKFGGHSRKRDDGYIKVYLPTHPYATKDGYVMEHILVMENEIGRYITRDKVVHHNNGVRDDNRLENLKLMTFKEHAGYHMRKRHEERRKLCLING